MSARAALRLRHQILLPGLLAALLSAGCSEAGMPYVSLQEAAKIGVATTRITVACGTADELRAFGKAEPRHLSAEDSIAVSGARKLAAVYRRDQSHIYEGESVGGVVHDSISLLANCHMARARELLVEALKRSRS